MKGLQWNIKKWLVFSKLFCEYLEIKAEAKKLQWEKVSLLGIP